MKACPCPSDVGAGELVDSDSSQAKTQGFELATIYPMHELLECPEEGGPTDPIRQDLHDTGQQQHIQE